MANALQPLGLQTIAIADIDLGDRLRQIDAAHAELLAQNMREVGRLRQPIEVRKVRAPKGEKPLRLIAGGHRLRAAEMLGWRQIDAFVFQMDNDQARLAEIDENLVRHDLNPLDRAVFLAARKQIYERLHPETRVGGDRRSADFQNDTMSVWSFARNTAEKCGITERTIQRAVLIANRLAPGVRTRIAGTAVARKQSELLALIKLPPARQHEIVNLVISGQARSVNAAERMLDGAPADLAASDRAKKVAALRRAWDRAMKPGRLAFLRTLDADERAELQALLSDLGSKHGLEAA